MQNKESWKKYFGLISHIICSPNRNTIMLNTLEKHTSALHTQAKILIVPLNLNMFMNWRWALEKGSKKPTKPQSAFSSFS